MRIHFYVGGERIGEWPQPEKTFGPYQVKGSDFARPATSRDGKVLIVARDKAGNTTLANLAGIYTAPFCFDAKEASKNNCSCGFAATTQIAPAGIAPEIAKGADATKHTGAADKK